MTRILAGAELVPLASGALWWPAERLLAVGDLHLGRAERAAREGRALLPPYETRDTLDRLDEALAETSARTVVMVGDSFDDIAAAGDLRDRIAERLARMAAGRRWLWIAGNHDPGPVDLPGSYLAELSVGPIAFRHVAAAGAASGEISAHYHPKVRLWLRGQPIARPCFLAGAGRIILPAFGTFTGGLDVRDPVFDDLVGDDAVALLTGTRVTALPRATICAAG